MKWSNGSMSDSLASYFAYKSWAHLKSLGTFGCLGEEQAWCRKNFLELRRLIEVKILSEDLTLRLEKHHNIRIPRDNTELDMQNTKDQFLLKILLCGAFYPNYFQSSSLDEHFASKELNGHNHLKTVVVRGLPDGGVPFYKRSLKALFRKCDPLGGEVKVHGDHTRAYIRFKEHNNNKSCSMAVCSAIKMRNLRMPMEVDYDPSEIVLEEEEEEDNEDDGDPYRWLRTMQVPLPPPQMKKIAINITETVDCGHFWGTYSDYKYLMQNDQMHKGLQEWVMRNKEHGLLKEIRIGSYCLCPFTDEDGVTLYYRAKIINRTIRIVKVFFLDYGNYSEVETSKLYKLEHAFLANPFQAMEFQLINIMPSPLLNFTNQWTAEAKTYFESIINNSGPFFCEIFSILSGVMRVKMFPVKNPDDDVAEKLVVGGFAQHCEESLSSKENHELRKYSPMPANERMLDTVSDRPNSSQSQTLDDAVKSRKLYKARQVRRLNQLKKVNLSGPTSSYELTFNPILSSMRSSKVERDSVNSIIICPDPSLSVPYVMVSAFVGISSHGSGLIIRDSTVLPMIRSLLPLVTLLFAPKAEYRTNKERTKYTGAICGLGYYEDSLSNEAIFAENDIELAFDTNFTLEHLKLINDIRVSMNLVMAMKITLFGSSLMKFQSAIRKKIFDLFCKPREPCDPEHFIQPLLWNKVERQHLILTKENDITFFMPHDVVSLRPCDIDERIQANAFRNNPLTPEQKRLQHNYLLKQTTRFDLDDVFHCLICNETIRGTRILATHLSLSKHLRLLDDIEH